MKRAIVVVIDSMGIGAMPDAQKYSDLPECNTLVNVAKFNNGLNLPNLQKLGLGNIDNIAGVEPNMSPIGCFGKMLEVSEGKDTTTGHWEMAGIILEEPFRTYPEGFPKFIIDEFVEKTGCGAVIGNIPASGTAIINELGDEHVKTKFPIIYTSADSVYQIACHVDVIPLETQYKWCEIAREILDSHSQDHNVCRVIARPFEGIGPDKYKRISHARRDYSVCPPKPTVLNNIVDEGGKVVGIGKIEDIFVKSGITQAIHTGTNKEGSELLLKALKGELENEEHLITYQNIKNPHSELIFVNLVDTDMLFGHRNDAVGYGKAIEDFDSYLGQILPLITKDDLLIITADHGCDPTMPGTDHTREMVPVIVYNPEINGHSLGLRQTFADIAKTISHWLKVSYAGTGTSLISE